MEGSREAWLLVLELVYSLFPRPELSVDRVHTMLPVLHEYDVAGPLGECLRYLGKLFPDKLSTEPEDPCYVLRWLKLADDLQLDNLHDMCMAKVRSVAASKQLHQATLSQAKPQGPFVQCSTCRAVRCASCPRAGSYAGDRHGYTWTVGSRSLCCSSSLVALTVFSPAPVCECTKLYKIYKNDKLQLLPAVEALSPACRDAILANAVAAISSIYVDTKRPATTGST